MHIFFTATRYKWANTLFFFTRYKVYTRGQSMHTVSVLSANDHIPFAHFNTSSFFPESSHHRIYQFLTQMKKNADLVLWTERKFNRANGIGRSSPMYVSSECWAYFCHRLREHESFRDVDFQADQKTCAFRTFYHDLSSNTVKLSTSLYNIEAQTSQQFKYLREIFGSSYGFGVRRPRDTLKSGTSVLSITDRINALDFFSTGTDDGASRQVDREESLDAPEISNKVIFCFNLAASSLTIRYYYRYMRVNSERGRKLLDQINLRLFEEGENTAIAEGSTFLFEGCMYWTLAHFSRFPNVRVINMMDETEHIFPSQQVRNLIFNHNMHENDDNSL